MLVCKGRSIEQISGYPPSTPVPVDPQHGILARRASITWGAGILALLQNGLGQVALNAVLKENVVSVGLQSELFGDDIKPLIDLINRGQLHATNVGPSLPSPAILNKLDLYLLANAQGSGFNDNVLMYYLGRSRGFSRLVSPLVPGGAKIITLKEIQAPAGGTGGWSKAGDGDYSMLALTDDARAYILFAGTQDGSLTATAVTQPLPTPADIPPDLWDTKKTFRGAWIEGSDLANFDVYFATDVQFNTDGTVTNFPWGPFKIIGNEVDLGVSAKQIVLKFVHAKPAGAGLTPTISYIDLDYDIEGETR